MRTLATSMRAPMTVALVGVAALGGCAHQQAENPALAEFPGIQAQIRQLYDDNATEDDWTCNEVELDSIDKSKVVGQSSGQVVIAVTYYFSSFDEGPGSGGEQCQGFNTRFFTFDKGSGNRLTLVSMTGPQRGAGA